MKKLSDELAWRGFVNQTTFQNIEQLDEEKRVFYFGVDPSANSMHIGQLAMAMMIRHFITYGYKPILLVGGATGLIGDPDGKDNERQLKTTEEVEANKKGILNQYQKLFAGQKIDMVDNYDWFKDINYLDFLRQIGKYVPMSQMLGRDFIQTRLGEGGSGISYAEFSYALIQGFDFLHLFRNFGVTLQLCGSDQWSNSLAGVELIRKIANQEAHIWSAPLIINKSTGKKFGKSEAGAVWLDEKLTSVYQFYQFWLNVDDLGVEDYLKIYTLLTKSEIDNLMVEFHKNPANRQAQKTLAYQTTTIVHGEQRAKSVARISEVLFGSASYNSLNDTDFNELKKELPVVEYTSQDILDILIVAKLASSRGEARKFLESGAVYINGVKYKNNLQLDESLFVGNNLVLRRGKNQQAVVSKSK